MWPEIPAWGFLRHARAWPLQQPGQMVEQEQLAGYDDAGKGGAAELRALDLPVYARAVSPATAVSRYASIAKDVPVECAGVTVSPGDIIVMHDGHHVDPRRP